MAMKTPFTLGVVDHFGLAVPDPKKSARWFERALGFPDEDGYCCELSVQGGK